MYSKYKFRGFSIAGTVAAIIAWIIMSYGIFTIQSSQFQMLISIGEATNAQKLAEADAALLKLVNYENLTNNSALEEVNLHLDRGDIKSIPTEGWEDEIIISDEKLNKNNPDYGRFCVATINIYKKGDSIPRYSMQTPISKSRQTYSRDTIDEFIEALRSKDRELEAKDRELEETDKRLAETDKDLEKAPKARFASMNSISDEISALQKKYLDIIEKNKCTCGGNSSDGEASGSPPFSSWEQWLWDHPEMSGRKGPPPPAYQH